MKKQNKNDNEGNPYKFIDSLSKDQKIAYRKKMLKRYGEMRELIEYIDSKLI